VAKFYTGSFESNIVECPVCGHQYMDNLREGSYCGHTVLFCVISPGSDPIFPFIRDDIQVNAEDVYDEETCRQLGTRLNLDIHYLTESGGYYPSVVVLGIST
jgi:hypothetical protein